MANLMPGNERPDEMDLPVELEEVQRRLLRDGAAWRAGTPDNERLNARVRALPTELPISRGSLGAEVAEHDAAGADAPRQYEGEHEGRGEMRRGHEGRTRAAGAWAGGAAAVAVVALLATLFARLASGQAVPGATGAAATPTPTTPAPIATIPPTVGSKYVSAVTAKGVDAQGNPVNPTGIFKIGETVFVIVTVHNIPAGQHRLTLRWFLNGLDIQLPPSAVTNLPISHDGNSYFGLNYPQAGRGAVRIYWDAPPSASEAQAEAYLARDVAFVVQDPRTPAPSPTPTATQGLTPTPAR